MDKVFLVSFVLVVHRHLIFFVCSPGDGERLLQTDGPASPATLETRAFLILSLFIHEMEPQAFQLESSTGIMEAGLTSGEPHE